MMATNTGFARRNFIKDNVNLVTSSNSKNLQPLKYSVDSKRAFRLAPSLEPATRNQIHEQVDENFMSYDPSRYSAAATTAFNNTGAPSVDNESVASKR